MRWNNFPWVKVTFCLALRDAYCCSVCRTHSVLSGAGYKSTPSSTFRNHWKTLFFPQKCYETPIWDIGVDAKMQMRHIHYYYSLLYVALVTFAGWNFCKSHCFKNTVISLLAYIGLNLLYICKHVPTASSTLKGTKNLYGSKYSFCCYSWTRGGDLIWFHEVSSASCSSGLLRDWKEMSSAWAFS